MRRINPNKIRRGILLLIGCFLIITIYRNHKNIQMLKSMEIYEVAFSYVKVNSRIEAFYMMCDPPDNRISIREKVDVFLETGNTIDALRARSKELKSELSTIQEEDLPLEGISIMFLKPSKDLGIGDFPEDIYDSEYRIGEQILLTVYVTFTGADRYEIEYIWPRRVK